MSQIQRTSTRYSIADPLRNVKFNEFIADLDEILEKGSARGRVIPSKGTQFISGDTLTGWTTSGLATATALDTQTFMEGTSSLKMGVSGVGTAVYEYAPSPIDMTGVKKFRLHLWRDLNLYSLVSGIEVRIGSDSSNYYSWTLNNADTDRLGKWYEEELNNFTGGSSGTDRTSTVGSPVITAIDFIQIRITATAAVTSGKVRLDNGRWAKLSVDIFDFAYFVGTSQGSTSAATYDLTASATNRAEVSSGGTVTITTAAFDSNKARIATIVAGANEITSITIARPDIIGGALSGSGGGFTTVANAVYNDANLLKSIDLDSNTYTFTYDSYAQLKTVTLGVTTWTIARDLRGRLSSLSS